MLPVIVFAIAMFLFFGVFLFYPLHRNVNLDPNPVIQAMLGEQLFVIHLKMWPLVGIAAAIACLYTLQRSLRVAGPLYRLWQVLMRMTQGQYQSVRFRDGDEFREFEGVTYRLARKMESLSGVSMTHLSKIESRLYQLKARIEMEDTSLESVRREIDVVLAEFKKPMLSKGP